MITYSATVNFGAGGTLNPSGIHFVGGGAFNFDTTGLTLLIHTARVRYVSSSTITVTDNKGNTYVALTPLVQSNIVQQIFYCVNPIVGTGHNFTLHGEPNAIFSWNFESFRGVGSYQTKSENQGTSSPLASGVVTPNTYGALVYTVLGGSGVATISLAPPGFSSIGGATPAPPSIGAKNSYRIYSVTTLNHPTSPINAIVSVNPTWSWTGTLNPALTTTAVFLPAFGTIPNLVGLTVAAAVAAITSAGYIVGKVGGTYGQVVESQTPIAGASEILGWPIDFATVIVPQPCALYAQDWSAGNSLFTSVADYEAWNEGIDPLYPNVEEAWSVTVTGGQLVSTVSNEDSSIVISKMGNLMMDEGAPAPEELGFWDASAGSVEFTWTPTADHVSEYALLLALLSDWDWLLSLEYDDGVYGLYTDLYWTGSWWTEIFTAPAVADVPITFKVSWKCSTLNALYLGWEPAYDGYLKVYIDGVAVYEAIDIQFWLSNTIPQNILNGLQFGSGDWFGALDNISLNICAPYEPAPEPFFDPDEAPIGLTWIEFTDHDGHRHVWSNIALPDPVSYFGGFKEHRVIEFGVIRRGLSNIDGQYEGIVWGWTLSG